MPVHQQLLDAIGVQSDDPAFHNPGPQPKAAMTDTLVVIYTPASQPPKPMQADEV